MSVTRWDPDSNPEQDWLEASVEQLADLRAQVLELGQSEATANGVVGWLLSGDPATSSTVQSRARYRKILREIGPPASPGPRRRRRTRAGQAGLASLELVSSVAGGGTVLALAPQSGPVGALAGFLGALVITRTDGVTAPQTATEGLCRAA